MRIHTIFAILSSLALAACGGGGGKSGGSAPTSFAVGGTVSGIVPAVGTGSQLVLVNNGGDPLFLNANGAFHFSHALSAGTAYNVTVHIQPVDPPETCVVHNGSGIAGAASAAAVSVACKLNSYTIGGTVTGLTGSALVLTDAINTLPGSQMATVTLSANGPFTFPSPVPTRSFYDVSVTSQPVNPPETCVVGFSSGTVENAPITNLLVTCNPNLFTVSGNVSGLAGSGLVLAINGGNTLNVSGNGPFAFTAPIFSTGAQYSITVVSQPSNPLQTCVVPNGSGTIANASVTAISVVCSAPRFAYGAGGRSDDILAYTIDIATGALTRIAGSPYPAGDSTSAITADPSYRFLYATNEGVNGGPNGNTVSAYTIDAVTGALTPVAGSPFASATAPISIAVEPSGRFAYVATLHNNTVSAYAINSGTGALTPIAGGPSEAGSDGPRHLSVHPSGKFLYLSVGNEATIWAYSIDPNSGALTPVTGSPIATLPAPSALAINPNGKEAYVATPGTADLLFSLFSLPINPATGALTPAFIFSGLQVLASAVVVEPSGTYLYAMYQYPSANVNGYVNSLEIIPNIGQPSFLTVIPAARTLTFPAALESIAADPSGRFIYVVDAHGNAYAYIIDHATGVLTAAATTPSAFSPMQPIVITKQ